MRPEEYEAAGRVVVEAYLALPGGHMTDGYAAELADVGHRTSGADVLVAIQDGLVGCVTLVSDESSPWAELLEAGEAGIRMLGVLPDAQGRGIGRALVEACLSCARRQGKAAVMLHTTPWMPAAHHLYERLGFERCPQRDWSPMPEVPLIAYRLVTDPGSTVLRR